MKVCLIQPYYSMDYSKIDECFNAELKLIDSCPQGVDVIVLPEYSDVVASTPNGETFVEAIEKYSPIIAKKAKEQGLDAIHDTVHEMARDEARHGRGLEGLLKRYFK